MNSPWMLFIDDERMPADRHEHAKIARSVAEAQELIRVLGAPELISFDHDLGDKVPTGFDLAKWLVEQDLDAGGKFLPHNFSYVIHSANPVGEKNIDGLLGQYLRYRLEETPYSAANPLQSKAKMFL